ncbi:MAG TPA: ribbon-helix-helix domain-containing protein [bacterium]|jgi:Arc/MetJ-type ribon-helix-helix transcriptional regulator|nr:ribbon-helix-helix domain-containing protein [bacterium]
MPGAKTITFSLPQDMVREVEQVAKEEHRTVSELLRETFRQYKARRNFEALAAETREKVKRKGLAEKDFGDPCAK